MDSNIVKLILAGLIVFIILRMISTKTQIPESFAPIDRDGNSKGFIVTGAPSSAPTRTQAPLSTGAPIAVSADLLPKPNDQLMDFAEFAPKALKAQNFLTADKYVGVNTQGSSLRNASWDIRAEVPNPRTSSTGPWMNSTIEADLLRKPLE